jgi:hypothetical protein
MNRIPVFIYKSGGSLGQVGDGYYDFTACFVKKGVHVSFSLYCHSENEYVEKVGRASACNGNCEHYPGHIEDWAKKRSDSEYSVGIIIEEANKFLAKKKVKNEKISPKTR